ncbi:MAG: hypothetical protein K8U03_19135, partial [Planctomycetia bacterium]|nr:hypothetical protein [Planctomycetia bacterium]
HYSSLFVDPPKKTAHERKIIQRNGYSLEKECPWRRNPFVSKSITAGLKHESFRSKTAAGIVLRVLR